MDKKLIVFLLIFFAFFAAYQRLVLEPYSKKPAPQPVPAKPSKVQPSAQAQPPAPVEPFPPAEIQAEAKLKTAVVETPLYRAEFSTRGAVLVSFRLNKYRDDYGRPLEMIPQPSAGVNPPISLDFEDKNLTKLASEAIFLVDKESASVSNHQKTGLRFDFSDAKYRFSKVFEFNGDSYLIHCTTEARNGESFLPVRVVWSPGLESSAGYRNAEEMTPSRGLVNSGTEIEHVDAEKVKEFHKVGATVRWAGVENNYFAGIFIPTNQPADAYINQAGNSGKKVHNVAVFLAAQKAEPLQMSLFVGPKDYVLLKQLGMDLEQVVDFGFFGPITKALFFTLKYFVGFTKNYGWAIVLLTILIKIIFTPFTQMSFASMKKMQQMQPELKKVQEKYGKMKNDDPRKQSMNVEIMQLHKRYGVNPLGGCFPMLLQMPVLFAFYSLLSNSIELRRAPFVLWLQDLSRPDPYYVTPVLMGATMLWQQRMTPSSDPMQKNMMYIMPIMFTWISLKLQSGLVLYWLLSNVLAIAHQYYFQWQQKPARVEGKNA